MGGQPDLGKASTGGLIYLGSIVAAVLLGFSIVQSYIYFVNTRDGWRLKVLVGGLLILDISGTALVSLTIYKFMLHLFNERPGPPRFTPTWASTLLVSSTITMVTQLFFAKCVYESQKAAPKKQHWIVPVAIAITAVAGLVCRVAGTILIHLRVAKPGAADVTRGQQQQILLYMAQSIAALSDVIATVAMCRSIVSMRESILTQSIWTLMRTLMLYILNRAVLVTVAQIALVIALVVRPADMYWTLFQLSIGKLYVNTLLAILNSRPVLRERLEKEDLYMPPTIRIAGLTTSQSDSSTAPTHTDHSKSSPSSVQFTDEVDIETGIGMQQQESQGDGSVEKRLSLTN